MTKRAFSLLFTLFLFAATTWGQNVVSMTASLNFQKKSGVSGTTYRMEDVQPAAPFITEISTGYDYQSSSVSGKKKKYRINNNTAEFGYDDDTEGYTLINVQFSNLIVGETYTVKLTAKGNGDAMEVKNSWAGMKDASGSSTVQPQWPTIGTSSTTITWTLKATQTEGSVVFSYNPSWNDKNLNYFAITNISISGKCKKMVTSSAGEKVCAGEPTTLTAVGLSGTIKWEKSIDNKATWEVIAGATDPTLQINVSQEAHYRASAGSDVIYTTTSIRPVVCCAADALVAVVLKESFSYSGGRKKLSDINSNASTTYTYKSSGDIDDGYYAVVKKASEGGHWQSTPVRTGHTKDGGQDGFLLVNAKKDPGVFFQYEVTTALCQNSYYDFSAWITNVDNTDGHAPVNATFKVVGYPSGKELVKTSTGNLGPGTDWTPKGGSFNSGSDTRFVLTIENNYQGTETKVIGNDIGIDDILFSACSPEIQIYSNNDSQHKHEPQVVVCNAGANQDLTLDALADYDLKEFFNTPHYLFQTSDNATGLWSNVGTGATTQESITITVDPTGYRNGLYYRVWVGATKAAVEGSATTGTQNTGCGALTAVSDPIKITYKCLCEASTAPTVKPYTECASTTKLDLHKQITSTTTGGTFRWYSSETATTPMTAAEAKAVDVSTAGTYHYYVTYQKDKDITTGDEYCESEKTELTVTVKDKITLTIDKSSISGCWANFESDASRTFTVTVPNGATIKWYSVDASGTETDLNNDNSKTYTIAKQTAAVSGKIRVKASSTSACENSVDATYALSENTQFTLSAPAMVCTTAPQADIKATITSGSGNYKWEKDGTEVKTGTLTAGTTELIYKDSSVGTTEGTVTYKLTIGDVTACGSSQTIEVAVGDKIKFEMSCQQGTTVCEGTNVTIKAERELLTGESFEWYKNDVLVSGVSGNTLNDTDALTANTTYKAVLKNGPCDGENTITINVDKKPQPVLSVTKSDICLGDTLSVINSDATVLGSNPTYKWLEDGVAITGESGKNLKQYKPQEQGTKTYTVEVTNGTCNNSATATANVHAAIEFTATADPAKICDGNPTTLTTNALQKYPSASFSWWLGTDSLSADTSYEVQPVQTGKVIYTAKVVDICQATKEVEVEVEPGIVAQLADSTTICDGDEATLEVHTSGNYNYKWVPAKDLATPEKQQTKASPNVDTWYYVAIFSDVCSTSDSIYVKVNPRPEITQLEETDKRQVTVDATGGTPDYTFYIDTKEVPYTYRVIGDVPIGYHRMYVVDAAGCEVDSLFEIAPIPITPQKFFTPNGIGDEKTNLWTVEDLDENYTSYIVEIYDRYGRRLYEYRTGSFNINSTNSSEELGWDGNYNGHQMPSDDYWYLITVEEIRKQYTGHFTLKR